MCVVWKEFLYSECVSGCVCCQWVWSDRRGCLVCVFPLFESPEGIFCLLWWKKHNSLKVNQTKTRVTHHRTEIGKILLWFRSREITECPQSFRDSQFLQNKQRNPLWLMNSKSSVCFVFGCEIRDCTGTWSTCRQLTRCSASSVFHGAFTVLLVSAGFNCSPPFSCRSGQIMPKL